MNLSVDDKAVEVEVESVVHESDASAVGHQQELPVGKLVAAGRSEAMGEHGVRQEICLAEHLFQMEDKRHRNREKNF